MQEFEIAQRHRLRSTEPSRVVSLTWLLPIGLATMAGQSWNSAEQVGESLGSFEQRTGALSKRVVAWFRGGLRQRVFHAKPESLALRKANEKRITGAANTGAFEGKHLAVVQ